MLIDLVIVAVLGGALAWSRPGIVWRTEISGHLRVLAGFGRSLLRTRLGHLLVLLSIASVLQWGAQVAVSGWSVFDPSVALGEVDETTRCHAWQARILKEGVNAFAPSEFVCPAGGGAYGRNPKGEPSCSVHGAPP